MKSKMKWTSSLLMAALLPSCGLNGSTSASNVSANRSALYDPPTLTMIDGTLYQFQEGYLTGSGQKWHSDYSFRRAVIYGGK